MHNYIVIGVSLPKAILNKIDHIRGDINRSRWILRALEGLMEATENKIKKSVQPVEVSRHDQAVGRVTTQTPLGVNADYDL